MKKIVSFTFAALLAVTSYSLADEFIDQTEEIDSELALAIEALFDQEVPQAESAQPGASVASQATVTQRNQNAQKTQRPQRSQKTQKASQTQKEQSDHVLTRKEIRSMDILDRPNRPGHFYGNTVRRRHGR